MNTDFPSPRQIAPHLQQLALQLVAFFFVICLSWAYRTLRHETLPWLEASLLIGGVGLLLAHLTKQSWWWKTIHALFAPTTYLFLRLQISPEWYLGAFLLTFLVYRSAFSGQIPLYFSNKKTAKALCLLLKTKSQARFLDLGAGIGSVVSPLARALPGSQFTGIENALIPGLIGYFRTAQLENCKWSVGNFWQTVLSDYDVVYAFLSPAPMPKLRKKIQEEMRPGGLFISNSFPLEGIEASFIINVDDSRNTQLYCYTIGTASRQSNTSSRNDHHSLRST